MTIALDLRRQSFGKWLVLYKGQQTAHGQFWICQCACNPAVTVALVEAALVEGWTRSCGCDYVMVDGRRCPRTDHVGWQIGKRLVLEFLSRRGRNQTKYRCRCVCGMVAEVAVCKLKQQQNVQCLSCAQRESLPSRWYGEVFVEGVAGVSKSGQRTYRARFPDGSVHRVRGDNLKNGSTTGVPRHQNYGALVTQSDMVCAWLSQGLSQGAIAQRLAVSRTSVRDLLYRHPEYHALAVSLPADEMLIGDAS